MLTLSAEKRTTKNLKNLRNNDKIPAVCYGLGNEAISITVPVRDFNKIWKEAGETTAVTIGIENKKVTTLIHAVQYHPITSIPVHIDFMIIDMKKDIEVNVPIEFVGLPEAEKLGLGTLVKVLHEIEIKALPADMPHLLTVDVSGLANLDSQIHVKDIKLPKGVISITDGDEVVALIASFNEEKETSEELDLTSIEVEKKGKKEEDIA